MFFCLVFCGFIEASKGYQQVLSNASISAERLAEMLGELNTYGAFFMQGLEMAGKSNKGKNRKGQNATSATENVVSSDVPVSDSVSSEANGNAELGASTDVKDEMKESLNGAPENQPKQGEVIDCVFFLYFFVVTILSVT